MRHGGLYPNAAEGGVALLLNRLVRAILVYRGRGFKGRSAYRPQGGPCDGVDPTPRPCLRPAIETEGTKTMNRTSLDEARTAKAKVLAAFRDDPSVVGVGITRIGEGYGVKLNLESPPAPDANLPKDIDGVPIRVEVVGTIRKR
jgi:hypothetical protein